MKATLEDQLAASLDIRYWYAIYSDKCPHCGYALKNLHPMANLIPHWTGECQKMNEEQEIKQYASRFVL